MLTDQMSSNDQQLTIIIGLGKTGLSVIRYLLRSASPADLLVVDSRAKPPGLAALLKDYPDVPYSLGAFDDSLLLTAKRLVVSPGVSLQEPSIAKCIAAGIEVIGDIELFVRAADRPIIAITGSNGKSTVTTLVGECIKDAGKRVAVGGNLGQPALELLEGAVDYYVLELSSFQLETTYSLKAAVAVVLNVCEDHMDRYENLSAYLQAKLRIYNHAACQIINLDDSLLAEHLPSVQTGGQVTTVSLNQPAEFRVLEDYLCYRGDRVVAVKELGLKGRHNVANALAALAIGVRLGLPIPSLAKTLRAFTGLAHRCQLVRELRGVLWYDDSKGTNVGATKAAIEGLGATINGKIILLAGGIGKEADFAPLAEVLSRYVRLTILFGRDAELIRKSLQHGGQFSLVQSLAEAVELANQTALAEDLVLLSPACASFDMFKNFEDRGEAFSAEVAKLF